MNTPILGRINGTWLNEPQRWTTKDQDLEVVTDEATDFWCETYYGFVRDSGHFLGFPTPAAFTAEVRVRGDYHSVYDQAGIMVRLDDRHWIKGGIEYSDGRTMLSSVLTADQSDWATAPYPHDPQDFRMRVTISEGLLRLQVSNDGKLWPLVRLAPFPKAPSYLVGPMSCTPQRAGLKVRFSDFHLSAPLNKDLHDLG